MKRHKLHQIRKALRDSAAEYTQFRDKDWWWRGTANGLEIARKLLDGQVIGNVLPKHLDAKT